MARFKDKADREWSVEIDVWALEVVQQRTGVKVHELVDPDKLLALFGDPVLTVRVLWVLIEDKAKVLGVTPEQFGRALAGDALEDAADALTRAVADFAPRRQRELLTAIQARGKELYDEQVTAALAAIEREAAAARERLARQRAETDPTCSTPATTSPRSAESIPSAAG